MAARANEQQRTASHGRGGAGNINARPENSGATANDLKTPMIKQATYTTGRGGSGNMANNDMANPAQARAAQDVETPAAHAKEQHGTFHWGRGGEGNMVTVGDGDRPRSKTRALSKNNGERRGSLTGMLDKGKELLGLNKKKDGVSRADESAIE